jgi:hypothetical protein
MKRSLVAVFATGAVTLALTGPAAAAESPASCAGLASSSVAGQPGARAEIQFGAFAEAENLGITSGALQSEFARFHDGSAEVCFG